MTRLERDPLAGANRLVIDGSNLLHALARSNERAGSAGHRGSNRPPGEPDDRPIGEAPRSGLGPPLPAAALVGRLRSVVPPAVRILLVFDGPPDRGLGTRRLTSGVEVRHSGRGSADRLILDLLADDPEGALVVTDDGGLGRAVRVTGAGHVRAAWLVARLSRQRLSGPSAGPRRPPGTAIVGGVTSGGRIGASRPPIAPNAHESDDDARRRWQPGRGATRKTGNPRRAARRRAGPSA